MRTCSILLALALTGCATTQTLTAPCVSQAEYNRLAAAEPQKVKSRLIGQGDADSRVLAGSAIELRAWGEAMLGTLKICSNKP
jgi:outer membrane lipoprotein SlyB